MVKQGRERTLKHLGTRHWCIMDKKGMRKYSKLNSDEIFLKSFQYNETNDVLLYRNFLTSKENKYKLNLDYRSILTDEE